MPEAKRPRDTNSGKKARSTTSRSTGKGSTAGTARGASSSSSAKRAATPKKPAARKPAARKPAARKPAPPRREELEPLDLEGTGFEELFEASSAGERRMKPGDPEVTVAYEDDLEAELDDLPEEESDPFASIRPRIAGRERERAATAASFATPNAEDPSQVLSERFGSSANPDASGEPIGPWSGLDDAAQLDDEAKPTDELLVGVLGLALAGVTAFMPWYTVGFDKLSGLAAGKAGVLTFVGGFGAFLIVLLRRLKVSMRFPLQTGVIIEGLAYLAIAGAVLGRFMAPDNADVINTGTLVPVGIGIALAFIAARLTSGAPLMVQPGWIRGQGGRLGAALLVLFVIMAGALAVVKPGAPQASAPTGSNTSYSLEPPSCLTEPGFPILAKVTPTETPPGYFMTPGPDGGEALLCGGSLRSQERIWTIRKNYLSALDEAGWTASVVAQPQPNSGLVTIEVKAPLCGAITLIDSVGNVGSGGKTTISIALQPCPDPPN